MEINITRCILILLIILIHLTPFKASYPDAQSAVLGFVVPLFLFITGYLFNVNKTWKQYASYLRSMVLMYVIFEACFIMLSFSSLGGGWDVAAILDTLLLHPIGPYWYLHTMIICGSIYYAMHRICLRYGLDCTVSLSVLASVILSYCTPLLGLMPPLAFFAGVIYRRHSDGFGSFFSGSIVALLIAIVTLIYGITFHPEYATQLTYFSILLSICVIQFAVWCAKRLPAKTCRMASFIGANTLPIYLFHPLFTLTSKQLLSGLITSGNIFLFCILTISAATTGSLLIGYIMDMTGVSTFIFQKKMMR